MTPPWTPPPPPNARLDAGNEWLDEWNRAHRIMHPYGRVPSMHLIDDAVFQGARRWINSIYDTIAFSTLNGRPDWIEEDGVSVWNRRIGHPATLRPIRLRVALGSDERTIVTAFDPDAPTLRR